MANQQYLTGSQEVVNMSINVLNVKVHLQRRRLKVEKKTDEDQSIKIPLEQIKEETKPTIFSKEFFRRWKEGIKNLPPDKQLKSKMHGHLGSIFGLSLAFVALLYKVIFIFSWVQLGFLIFLFFIVWLQVVEYISTKQKYENIKKIMDEVNPDKMLENM